MKVAKELVAILPKANGTREGMYHDILHALEVARRDERERIINIANVIACSSHEADTCARCLIQAIRQQPERSGG